MLRLDSKPNKGWMVDARESIKSLARDILLFDCPEAAI